MMDCLAKWVLSIPGLTHRRTFIDKFQKRAGTQAAGDLRDRMMREHKKRRSKYQDE